MKKRMIALLLVGAFLITGCGLAERFQEAKDAYLEQRVDELLEDDAAELPVADEGVPATEEEPEAVDEPKEVEAEEMEPEPTEEPVAEEEAQPEETEEPDDAADDAEDDADADETADEDEADVEETLVIESDDPGVYLGEPDWIDEM